MDAIPVCDLHLEAKMQTTIETDPGGITPLPAGCCTALRARQAPGAGPSSGAAAGKWAVSPAGSTQQDWESHFISVPLHLEALKCPYFLQNFKQFFHFIKVISEKATWQITDKYCYFDCFLKERNTE